MIGPIHELAYAIQMLETGDYVGTSFAVKIARDNALERVSTDAIGQVRPHQAIAIQIAGFRLAMDVVSTHGPEALADFLEGMETELLEAWPKTPAQPSTTTK